MSQFVGNDSYLRRSHRNCRAITNDVTLACNIPTPLSRSTVVNLGIVYKQCVILNSNVLKRFQTHGMSYYSYSSLYMYKFKWDECTRETLQNKKIGQFTGLCCLCPVKQLEVCGADI